MTANSILILGGSGQIGQTLISCANSYPVTLHAPERRILDMTDHPAAEKFISGMRPRLIINLAALSSIDFCEENPDKAGAVNFVAVANLASQCATYDIPLIHLSTDNVFNGRAYSRPYLPTDPVSTISIYGESKMLAEESIRQNFPWHVIIRTSRVFSAIGDNTAIRFLESASKNSSLKIAQGQVTAPTYAPSLARAILMIASHLIEGRTNGFGTFHFTGTPAISKVAFCESLLSEYAQLSSKSWALDAIPASDDPAAGLRPEFSVLDCQKITDIYGLPQEDWHNGVKETVTEWLRLKDKS